MERGPQSNPVAQKQSQADTPSPSHLSKSAPSPYVSEILRLHRTLGNRAVQRLLLDSASTLQRKAINEPGDEHEREADRVSNRVVSDGMMDTPEPRERNVVTSLPRHSQEPRIVQEALRSGGQPLDPAARQFMEARFGRDFEPVRVHTGASAGQSARALDAVAYTSGLHLVFAEGAYAPATTEGRRLIAHELTHVEQQSGARGPAPGLAPAIQRQPARAPGSTWKDLWPDFGPAKVSWSAANAMKLAKEIAAAPRDLDDTLEHGLELVEYFQHNGEPEAAARMLDVVRTDFTLAWSVDRKLPNLTPFSDVFSMWHDPIELGKEAARAGRHEEAFRYFGVAHEILSFYAAQRTTQRAAGDSSRVEAYSTLQRIYNSMREIYGFYGVLEQEALTSGDAGAAAQFRAKGVELRKEVKEKYSPTDEEVERVEATSVGDKLEMEGANGVTEVLTELPGLTTPGKSGEHARTEKLTELQNALVAQAELQAEIGREPEIRRVFAGKPIDLNDTGQRQQVWRIMYTGYQKAGSGALGQLMALIGRYLKAFTVHTDFNIRDFGQNYLDSKFPADLAGRAEKDCGVYALHVAWDVFQTVKQADSKLDVRFRLATSLDHVTLIIDDKSTAETYLVNNDTIVRLNQTFPPAESYLRPFFRPLPSEREMTGAYDDQSATAEPWVEPELQVAKEYANLRGLPYLATPFFFSDLGSTKNSVTAFHSGVWSNYLTATGEMANKEGALNQALKTAKQGNVHSLQKAFAENALLLDNLMDQLAPFANDRDALESKLADDMDFAIVVLVIFEKFAKGFLPINEKHQFSYSWSRGSVHPLVRVALAILRLRKLGGTITENQTKFLTFCEKTFKELAVHREAGEAGRF